MEPPLLAAGRMRQMRGSTPAAAGRFREFGAWLRRAKDVLQREGLVPLLLRGLRVVRESVFECGEYYLCEHSLEEREEARFLPKIDDPTFRVVRTNDEADELATALGSDFRRRFVKARGCLDKGAIAFCFFVNGEIAHVGWVALTKEAKEHFDPLPYEVDFSGKVACTGGTITVPQYSGRGLMTYGYFKRLQFLREMGWKASRNAVAVDNAASLKAHAKFRPRTYARARYLKLLRLRFLWERPLT